MMNKMKKQDGYVLVYVLVVVLVIGIVAVSALTAAGRNLRSQAAAVKYTQDKYEAEGAIELFVAELQAGAVEYAESLQSNVTAAELNAAISGIIGSSDDGNGNKTGIYAILDDRYGEGNYELKAIDKGDYAGDGEDGFYADIEPLADAEIEDDGETQFVSYTKTEQDPLEKGNAFYLINVTARFGSVQISADMKLSFPVEKGDGYAKIRGVAFEYISYEVTTVQEENQEVGS